MTPGEGEPEAIRLVGDAKEASAYAAGAARASWESLARASAEAEEAGRAWLAAAQAEMAEGIRADLEEVFQSVESEDLTSDVIAEASDVILQVLPTEARRNMRRAAAVAASRAREAKEAAEFAAGLAGNAAQSWARAEAAWRSIEAELGDNR